MTLRARGALAAILVLFIASAMIFVRRPGIEVDEAVVTNPPSYLFYSIPLMNMSYVGALKSWFYTGLFAIVKPGPVSLRTPTVLLGGVAVWLFFLLLDRTLGRRAAWIGALLLATDSMFVILEAIDFGPNAVHFVFKLGALVLLVRFHRKGSLWILAAAFFLFGLGLWDKAIFLWSLFGISLGALAAFPRELWRHITIRNLAVATIATIVGALPLVIYNIDRPLDTFKSNVHLVREPFLHKYVILERTLNSSVLFGFFTSVEPNPHPGEANTRLLKISQAVSDAARHPTHNLTIPALCIACLGLFARVSRRAVLFGILACAGTWLPMLLTAGTGGAAHHVVLLWPFHFLALAAALAAIPSHGAGAAFTVILCVSNVLVTNEYYWELVRNGPDIRWTDAIYPLEKRLEKVRSARIYVIDWGIVETVNLLSDNSIPVQEPDWSSAAILPRMVSDPDAAFVAHTAGHAYFPQRRQMLEETAAAEGYEEVPVDIVYDRNGRARFDIFRFRKIPL